MEEKKITLIDPSQEGADHIEAHKALNDAITFLLSENENLKAIIAEIQENHKHLSRIKAWMNQQHAIFMNDLEQKVYEEVKKSLEKINDNAN